MDDLIFFAALFVVFTTSMHFGSILVTLLRLNREDAPPEQADTNRKVSLLRPLCGLENHLEETLASSFHLDYPVYEILFCVTSPTDPVIPLVERLIAENPQVPARLLIGDDPVSANPKLNNLVKGWREARHDWVIMSDSNLLLPQNYITSLMSRWQTDTGLVSSPPVGLRPEGFAAALECAFLNSYQARWQIASDQVGMGFAQGKTLFWNRHIFEQAGGFAALAEEMAEDVASTKLVHNIGMRVRLAKRPFSQLIGRRDFASVWARQKRWAVLRRSGFIWIFLPELFTGIVTPLLALAILVATGELSVAFIPLFVALWYGAEWVLARSAGWPASACDVVAWMLRDAMIPVLWMTAWRRRSVSWRGNTVAETGINTLE